MLFHAAGALCASSLPQPVFQETSTTHPPLRFGQSLALADFDGDHRIDRAELGGTGRHRSIDIRLSKAKAHNILYFDVPADEAGSLFTDDVDNDGDNDLVWSDLCHPDDVIVWLDDGTGRFERVCPTQYANTFVISTTPSLLLTEIPHLDIASSPGSELSAPPSHSAPVYIRCSINERRPVHQVASSLHLRTHFVRGPPDLV